jgi:hypothetical protein
MGCRVLFGDEEVRSGRDRSGFPGDADRNGIGKGREQLKGALTRGERVSIIRLPCRSGKAVSRGGAVW